MNMKAVKVKYISDKKSIFFNKGEVYDAYIPIDDKSGKFFAFHLEEMDEPGYYALPASRFEVQGVPRKEVELANEELANCEKVLSEFVRGDI